ncbi:hypothetical protein GCM10020367_07380 [Streptomyces sannanensis]|uniref:Uncharacterized protein n=1 Tax=Streptomyces sannanensis TaxID=285536 RepID=A0ABP6S5D4_9ACTN
MPDLVVVESDPALGGLVSEPTAILLIGITGSRKTSLAQALADRGLPRLSVDEEIGPVGSAWCPCCRSTPGVRRQACPRR